MANIERYYPVVGVLEESLMTYDVLEDRLPRFFRGMSNLSDYNLSKDNWSKKLKYTNLSSFKFISDKRVDTSKKLANLSNEHLDTLRKHLAYEYDLYYYCLARLKAQASVLPKYNLNTKE